MSVERGWVQQVAPLRQAGEVMGTILPAWAQRTGLSKDVQIYCGLHDSNAALLGARLISGQGEQEMTVLSTGTWFVAMRTPGKDLPFDPALLQESRDCLINVDPWGGLVPSARFMGGREIELLSSRSASSVDLAAPDSLQAVIDLGIKVLPTMVPGTGPFPSAVGRWERRPHDSGLEAAAVGAYAALMAETSLSLIGARDRIVVEGRFARDRCFVEALATLRPRDSIYVGDAQDAVSLGALRLLHPNHMPSPSLRIVEPLPIDFARYRSEWLQRIEAAGGAT